MFHLRTVDRLSEPGPLTAHKGTVVHGVLERLYDLSASKRFPQAALKLLSGQWALRREKNPEVMDLFGDAGQAETWLEEVHGLVHTHFTLESPQRLELVECGLFVQTEIGDDLFLRDFVNHLDAAPNDAMRVVDYKTGHSPDTHFMEEVLFQMCFYALVLRCLRGRTPTRLRLIYLKDRRVLTHNPRLAELECTKTRLIHLWDEVESYTRSGPFHLRRSRLCDWCVFRAQCLLFGGTTPQAPDDGIARLLTARRIAA